MNCMNCGAKLGASAYCPSCGKDISVQKQAIFLSELYYNQGLEKAQIRDLSGAIERLKQSLKFNKLNVNARNLLGLVYFETGEVVAALSEWVISKNIQPVNNAAEGYIADLRKDSGKLDEINDTIKKFNIALANCQEGNEDVAEIQLKKILTKNPKLIKCYHLLSLLYIKNKDYERARRLLIRAARIDRTNTTTLRFLKEVDEQTGKATNIDGRFGLIRGRKGSGDKNRENAAGYPMEYTDDGVIVPAAFKVNSHLATFWNVLVGIVIGAAVVGLLIMPARLAKANRDKNEEINKYSVESAELSTEVARLTEEIESSQESVDNVNNLIATADRKTDSYANLLDAVLAYRDGRESDTVSALQKVDKSLLSESALETYNSIRNEFPDSMFEGEESVPIAPDSVSPEETGEAGTDTSAPENTGDGSGETGEGGEGEDTGYTEDTGDSEGSGEDDEYGDPDAQYDENYDDGEDYE